MYTVPSMDAQTHNEREAAPQANPVWFGSSAADPTGQSSVPATYASADQSLIGGAGSPAGAADGDTIEPEWVRAVEQAIDQYREDPYRLAIAISNLRADYLNKRYNKQIKVLE